STEVNLLYLKRNRYFTDHVGYTVELACFNLFVNAIVLFMLASITGLGKYMNEIVLTVIFICTNLYFVLRSSYQFYGEKNWRLVIKSVVVILFLKVSLEMYRMILFFVTVVSL
ncbi:MAG: hypothetical protein ACKO96_39720, partial [Flammeovirgaceae bacterium]